MVTKAEGRVGALATWVVLVGVLAAFWGVAYDINAVTQAHAAVKVPVGLLPPPDGGGWDEVWVSAPGISLTGTGEGSVGLAGSTPEGLSAGQAAGAFTLIAWGSTRIEQALSRGAWVVGGFALLALALLLRPVLWAIARGTPFARGSGTRLVAAGGITAVAWCLAPQLPAVASGLVLARTGLEGGRLVPSAGVPLWPLLLGALLAALGVAFRRGEALAREAEGLV